MRIKHWLMKWSLLVLLLTILAQGSVGYARVLPLNLKTALAQATRPRTVTIPESFIVEAERTAVERDHLKTVVALQADQIKAQSEQIAGLNSLVTIERSRGDAFSKAALERKDALSVDDKRVALYEADVSRLRNERDQAKTNNKWWGVVGVALGVSLGILSQRR